MTIFYQHIGERLWPRDVPCSIGTAAEGLKRFTWADIEPHLTRLDPLETISIRDKINTLAPTGFQIWGIPSGAGKLLSAMETGDFLMLLESTDFGYAGQVIERISIPQWKLSSHIWGEERFPLIILLQGEIISYSWDVFKAHFGYSPNLDLRGKTARVSSTAIQNSSSESEEAFIAMLLTTQGKNSWDQQTDFNAFASNLQFHFRMVKARAGQQAFRRKLVEKQGCGCAVCGIAIDAVIDAAHLVPKEEGGSDDHRNGLVLCSLHHRMFDAGLFAVHPETLSIHSSAILTLPDLRITLTNINHLPSKPHQQSLEWRWNWFNDL